jgi:hypothetical protein
MAREVERATQIPSGEYTPKLRELPQDGPVEALNLASREPVFPRRATATATPNEVAECKLVPVLFPLSILGKAGLPQSLPPFQGLIDAAAATEWAFLLRLNPQGGVADCVSLTKAKGADLLENWLRGVAFDATLGKDSGWIAVGVQFHNQPTHGPNAR